VTQIERELGITHGLLRDWEAKLSVNSASGEIEASEVAKLKAENRQLKRELEQLRMEREVLKKTVKIFSQSE
jgi:transposase